MSFLKKLFGKQKIEPAVQFENNEIIKKEDKWSDLNKKYEAVFELNQKYKPVLDAHALYAEQYEKLYSVLLNGDLLKTDACDKLIELLLADIRLMPQWEKYHIEYKEIFEETDFPRMYSAFCRLAIVYEKREEYEKAIEICKTAINQGFDQDNTKGGMQGRIARLCKKANLNVLDYINLNEI